MRFTTFVKHDINEMGMARDFMDGVAHPRFRYEQRMVDNTDKQLLQNFFKCCAWVKENYPNLTELFHTYHNPYYKLDVDITDGQLTLCLGDHSAGYSNYLNTDGFAVYSQGSEQRNPYFFEGIYGFSNVRLIEFLEQWNEIKSQIVAVGNSRNHIYSDKFSA